MWLLNVDTRKLESFVDEVQVSYAIASHTWDEVELSFQDIQAPNPSERKGYAKVNAFCNRAQEDGIAYVWIDTCCINKESSAELSEAINCMYRWYYQAVLCYVHLAGTSAFGIWNDFRSSGGCNECLSLHLEEGDGTHRWHMEARHDELQDCIRTGIERSRWFTRGWTLQEMIAPVFVEFYDTAWNYIGSKNTLRSSLSRVTGVEASVLRNRDELQDVPIARRLSWAARRKTQRVEDEAYSLLGILDINMPMLYGEGDRAFHRLQQEFIKTSVDQSIFAWDPWLMPTHKSLLLSPSPYGFRNSGHIALYPDRIADTPFDMSNMGLRIQLPCYTVGQHAIVALNCRATQASHKPVTLRLVLTGKRPQMSENSGQAIYEINRQLSLNHESSYNRSIDWPKQPLSQLMIVSKFLTLKDIIETKKYESTIKWITTLNSDVPREFYYRTHSHLDGSLDWFFREEAYSSWSFGVTPFLWVHGQRGSGKSILASYVYRRLFEVLSREEGSRHMAAAAVFCGYGRALPRSARDVLECLLREVVQSRGKVSARVDDLRVEHMQANGTTRPYMADTVKVLLEELQDFSESFIIVDRIDKLESEAEMMTLLDTLRTFKGLTKVMVTSATRSDFQAYLDNANTDSLFPTGSASIDITKNRTDKSEQNSTKGAHLHHSAKAEAVGLPDQHVITSIGTQNQQRGERLVTASDEGQASDLVFEGLREKMVSLLMIESKDITPERPLEDYGLDSLVVLDLRAWITEATHVELNLPAVLGCANLNALARKIMQRRRRKY